MRLSPALDNGVARCSTHLLPEHDLELSCGVHQQVIQGVDDRIVDETDEAGSVRRDGLVSLMREAECWCERAFSLVLA